MTLQWIILIVFGYMPLTIANMRGEIIDWNMWFMVTIVSIGIIISYQLNSILIQLKKDKMEDQNES